MENVVALPEALQRRVKIHAQASVAGRHAKQRQAQVFCRNQKQRMTQHTALRAENNKHVASPELKTQHSPMGLNGTPVSFGSPKTWPPS